MEKVNPALEKKIQSELDALKSVQKGIVLHLIFFFVAFQNIDSNYIN